MYFPKQQEWVNPEPLNLEPVNTYLKPMEKRSDFEWDSTRDQLNQKKHGVSFALAQLAFLDHHRVILDDLEHSDDEKRYYCLGRVSGGIMTVRLTNS